MARGIGTAHSKVAFVNQMEGFLGNPTSLGTSACSDRDIWVPLERCTAIRGIRLCGVDFESNIAVAEGSIWVSALPCVLSRVWHVVADTPLNFSAGSTPLSRAKPRSSSSTTPFSFFYSPQIMRLKLFIVRETERASFWKVPFGVP